MTRLTSVDGGLSWFAARPDIAVDGDMRRDIALVQVVNEGLDIVASISAEDNVKNLSHFEV